MPGIMSGIRVLELASWTYVPMAGGVLAEWGADVIKVENPQGGGDPQRALARSGLVPSGGTVSFVVEHPNRGKRSVGLDITSPQGRELLMKLAASSDVFLTNFLPQTRKRLRIEVEDLRSVNPSIIYVRGSGNGQRGPESHRGGYDGCTFWARGGSADTIMTPTMEYPPSQPGGAYGDTMGGLTIAGGIAGALLYRERTGEALTVDCSLLAMGMWATAYTIAGAAACDRDRLPAGMRSEAPNPIVNTYRTSDDRFVSLIMLESDRYWADLMEKVGRPELIADPRFADNGARGRNNKECIVLLDEIFGSRTLEEWKVVLSDVKGVWSPVSTPREVIEDPQVVANDYVRDVAAEDGSTFKLVAVPLQFNETPSEIERAPKHGEHTDQVLQEIGLKAEEIASLKMKGAVL
jgi:crotonobetainyl-CoA:carnitine CoA-transferase CaiB-like acyl-CoA transferase